MVNGQWLMRDRYLLTLDEASLVTAAQDYARRIDTFLIQREESVLSKLVAIEGTTEGESFEIQAKVRIFQPNKIEIALHRQEVEILYHRHYHEYDTYFHFEDPNQGRLRYREDENLDENGKVSNVRYRLTLVGPSREDKFPSDVLLSRSRYIAPATHSLRFYREYFKPDGEVSIEKDRLRWRVLFKGIEFFVNLDHVIHPDLGYFIEVKSRTWSRRDAEIKSAMVSELLEVLGVSSTETVTQDYIEFILE